MSSEYYCEEEVARLIQNLVQWSGDGAAVRTSASIWERLVREVKRGSAQVVTVGIDAGHTKLALEAIAQELADALREYHTSGFPLGHQVRKLRISRPTYRRRLDLGHVEFMRAYQAARSASRLAIAAPTRRVKL